MELSKTRKNTTDLLRDLKQSEKFSDFVKKNGKSLKHGEFTETLNRYFRSQGRSKAEIARAAGISEAYLKQCGYATLYARDKRDAVILHGLMHGMELNRVNDTLFEVGEAPLLE